MPAEVLKQFDAMGIDLKKQQCGHADAGRNLGRGQYRFDENMVKHPVQPR